MRILFTGGGTLGSVTPLLAIAEEIRCQVSGVSFVWIGTRKGPERKLVEDAGVKFLWMWTPKWRRYFDVRNFFAPIFLGMSVCWAFCLLMVRRPDVIVTAGGFMGVPLVWAGWFFRIPTLLHNQDVRFSLANRLVAFYVSRITYALPDTLPSRFKKKAIWTGNPIRSFVLQGDRSGGLKLCGFSDQRPTILVVGGGTGAQQLNAIVIEALPELTKKYQVIHVTGRGKIGTQVSRYAGRYCCFEFVTREMGDLLAAADLVITRAGMGFLNELAALGKSMVIIPIPRSHQEENARYFQKKGSAIVLDQARTGQDELRKVIDKCFFELGRTQERTERLRELVRPDAAKLVAREVTALAKK